MFPITSRCKPDKPIQTDDLDHPDPGSRPDPSSVKARADGVEPVNEPINEPVKRPDHGRARRPPAPAAAVKDVSTGKPFVPMAVAASLIRFSSSFSCADAL
jgi:hypothetical protein